jgi:hypothetical protein
MKEVLVPLEDRSAWESALQLVPHGYWHTWSACAALQAGHGMPTFMYVLTCGDGSVAVCPFAVRSWRGGNDIFSPAGFAGFTCGASVPEARDRWSGFAARQGYVCGYFALHPALQCNPSVHFGLQESNELYVLDLRAGAEAVRASADRSVQRAIRGWESAGYAYVTDRKLLTAFLLGNYHAFMGSHRANSSAIWSQSTLELMCADPAILMVGAADEQGLCAMYSFAATAFGAECHVNVSIRDGRAATTPLIWWGVRELASRGVPWLNMGGGVARGDSIALAKQKFRPQARPLLAAREIYRKGEYEALCRLAGVDPELPGYFPPYRRTASAGARPDDQ